MTARAISRMGVDDRPATIQLIEDRLQPYVAEPDVAVAGEQADTVRLERVEGVLDLAKARVDVAQRQRREQTESPFVVRNHASGELIHVARERHSPLALAVVVVGKPDAGIGDR